MPRKRVKRKIEKKSIYGKTRKRRRLNYRNIFLLLFIITFIIFSINTFRHISFNREVYNNIKNKEVTISLKTKYLKLSKKNINYIKSNKIKVNIKYKKYCYILNNSNLQRKINIRLKTYSKKITNNGFGNSKSYFIEKNNYIKDDELKISLPSYLVKNKNVDVYGISDNKYEKLLSHKKIINDSIKIKLNKKYSKYIIVYVKLKDISLNENISILTNTKIMLNIKFNPSKATYKNIKYVGIDEKFIENNNGELRTKNDGMTSFKVVSYKDKILKTVKVNISKIKYEVETKDGLSYIDGILLANKTYSLPKEYNPGKLNEDALNAFHKMESAALTDNIKLWIASGFRSYETQEKLYNEYVSKRGQETSDTFSARPGFSEHQTGYAMDLNIVDSTFVGTPEAKWLEKNCYKYGFIIRYPKGKQNVTGYMYEPWHVRYLGIEKATKLYKSGLTIEEYYGISSSYM